MYHEADVYTGRIPKDANPRTCQSGNWPFAARGRRCPAHGCQTLQRPEWLVLGIAIDCFGSRTVYRTMGGSRQQTFIARPARYIPPSISMYISMGSITVCLAFPAAVSGEFIMAFIFSRSTSFKTTHT